MTDPDRSRPLGALRGIEVAPLAPEREAARQQRVVLRIQALQAELGAEASAPLVSHSPRINQALSRWLWLTAALVPAAAALVFVLRTGGPETQPLIRVWEGAVVVESAGHRERLERDAEWRVGDAVRVTTEGAEAKLRLPSDASVVLGRQTLAAIERNAIVSRVNGQQPTAGGPGSPDRTQGARVAETIRLERGSVDLEVPQLPTERELFVLTEHVRVAVRGTAFAVRVEPSGAGLQARTEVTVREGAVSVFSEGHEERVGAGQRWESGSTKEPAAAAPVAPPLAVASGAVSPQAPAPVESQNKRGHSALAEQNQLFESAQAARRNGQTRSALQRFQTLIRRFPASEQAHNARVEHFRLLAASGRMAEARLSAQAYLKAYPNGFARSEAARLTR